MNEKNRDSHQIKEHLNCVLGERTEEHSIQRGSSDRNRNIDYHIENLFDIPSQFPDALIVGLLFMSLYFSNTISSKSCHRNSQSQFDHRGNSDRSWLCIVCSQYMSKRACF